MLSLKKFFILILINCYSIVIIFTKLYTFNKDLTKKIINKIDSFANFCQMKTNIKYDDEIFQLAEVKEQIKKKNISYIETISGGSGNIGNALIMLNNLITLFPHI